MSTLSTTTVTTANGSTNLTVQTGNTTSSKIIINSSDGQIAIANSTANTFTILANGNLTIPGVLSGSIFTGNTVLVKETIYVENGTHTKVGNLVSMMVYCIGAGGGGGGATGTAVSAGSFGAAGGAGGGASIKILIDSEVGATSNVVVGIGGSGGSNTTVAGGTGSNSSFALSNGFLIVGRGGAGATGATPGTGATDVSGDLNIPGQSGSRGFGNGMAIATSLSGFGGSSAMGFGGGGGSVRNNSVGIGGTLYGGGGGGGAQGNTAASQAGGAGANGVVWVIEYYNGA
jgi:hypothetical protein